MSNFEQGIPRETKGQWVKLERKDGTFFKVKVRPGDPLPELETLPYDKLSKHSLVSWTDVKGVKGHDDAFVAQVMWDVPFMKDNVRNFNSEGEEEPIMEQVPATSYELMQLGAMDAMLWTLMQSVVEAMNGDERLKGLTQGEVFLNIMKEPAVLRKAIDEGVKRSAEYLIENASL